MLLCIPLEDSSGLNSRLARDPRSGSWFLLKHSNRKEFTLMSREDFLALGESLQGILQELAIDTLITTELQPMARKVLRDSGVAVLRTDAVTAGQVITRFACGQLMSIAHANTAVDSRETWVHGSSCSTAYCQACQISSCSAH